MYHHIATIYDQIFPIKPELIAFLTKRVPKGNLLDLGCGSGQLAIELAKRGYQVTGLDLSEDMIAYARSKDLLHTVNFTVGDFQADIPNEMYDGIFLLGNTLAYTKHVSDLLPLFKKLHLHVKPGGMIILSLLNYERILSLKQTTLPAIQTNDFRFERTYEFKSDHLLFHTCLKTANEETKEVHRLTPLPYSVLLNHLTEAGLNVIETWGSFLQEPYEHQTSTHLLMTIRKEVISL